MIVKQVGNRAECMSISLAGHPYAFALSNLALLQPNAAGIGVATAGRSL
jgi:hypothetical protein